MKSIAERARLAARQIFEEIGLSKHSVDRVSEIIAEKLLEQKEIDIEKACKLIDNYIADLAYPVGWADAKLLISIPERFRKAMKE